MRLIITVLISVFAAGAALADTTIDYQYLMKDTDYKILDISFDEGTATILVIKSGDILPSYICEVNRDSSKTPERDECRELGR